MMMMIVIMANNFNLKADVISISVEIAAVHAGYQSGVQKRFINVRRGLPLPRRHWLRSVSSQ